jgi:hypothetical protein
MRETEKAKPLLLEILQAERTPTQDENAAPKGGVLIDILPIDQAA